MDEAPYRVAAPEPPEPPAPPGPPDPYLRAWRSLRKWRRRTIGGFVATGGLLLLSRIMGKWVLPLLVLALALTFVSYVAVLFFPCPRCRNEFGHRFVGRYLRGSIFARVCAHCGLGVGTPKRSPEQPRTVAPRLRVAPGREHESESADAVEYGDVDDTPRRRENG